MVEIAVEPRKKIVIHGIIENEFRWLSKNTSGWSPPGGKADPIKYANGVIFEHPPFPDAGEA